MQTNLSVKPEAKPLSERERKLLKKLETTIKTHLTGFKEVGQALAVIQKEQLYRENYDTAEEYWLYEWEISRARAYQYISAYLICDILSTIVDKDDNKIFSLLPVNEGQCRALAEYIEKPQQLQMIWQAVLTSAETSGEKITAAFIVRTIEALRDEKVTGTLKRATQREIYEYTLPQPIKESFQTLMLALHENKGTVLDEKGRKFMATMLRQLLETIEK